MKHLFKKSIIGAFVLAALGLTGCNSLSLAANKQHISAAITAFYDNPRANKAECYALSESIASHGKERQLRLLYNSVLMNCSSAGKMSDEYRKLSKTAALKLLDNATE